MKKNICAMLFLLQCFPYFLNASIDSTLQKAEAEETVTIREGLVFSKFPLTVVGTSTEDVGNIVNLSLQQIINGKPVYLLTLQKIKAREAGSYSPPSFVTNMYYEGGVYEDVPEKSILVDNKVASIVSEEGYRKYFVTLDKQKIGPYDKVIRLYGHNNKLYFYATIGGETYLYNSTGDKVVGPFQKNDPYINLFMMSYENSSDWPLYYSVTPVKKHLTKDESNGFLDQGSGNKNTGFFSRVYSFFKKKDSRNTIYASESIYKVSVGSTTLASSDFPLIDITGDTSNLKNIAYIRNYPYVQDKFTKSCYSIADLKGWVFNECKDKGVVVSHLKAYDSQNKLVLFSTFSPQSTLILSNKGVQESYTISDSDDFSISNGKLVEINTKGQSSSRKEVIDIKYDGKSILSDLGSNGLSLFKSDGPTVPVAYMIGVKLVILVTDQNNKNLVLVQK